MACEDYKKTETDLLHNKAENIYKAFVHSDAVKQVSIKVIVISIRVCKFYLHTEIGYNEIRGIIVLHIDKYIHLSIHFSGAIPWICKAI